MRCPACGQDFYGIIHECSGSSALLEAELSTVPTGTGIAYYLREAFAIARWDDFAVQRAARDPKALLYGLVFLAVAFLLGFVRGAATALLSGQHLPAAAIVGVILVILPLLVVLTLVYYGVCHHLARWLFGAKGTYVAILRPMMLGSVVQWVVVVPVLGDLVARLWSLGVFMFVLSEVDGIERMQAVLISIGMGIVLIVLTYFLAPALLFR